MFKVAFSIIVLRSTFKFLVFYKSDRIIDFEFSEFFFFFFFAVFHSPLVQSVKLDHGGFFSHSC